MTNAELIEALRLYAEENPEAKLLNDTADALEAADIKIADYTAAVEALDDSNDAYIKENERLKKRIAELQNQVDDITGDGFTVCQKLVRCKECRWGHLCVFGQHLGLDGFCSKGERKDDE